MGVAAQIPTFCLLFLTGMAIYFPIIYIRKTNKILKALDQIDANTRKQ